jgi:hypothetical protein
MLPDLSSIIPYDLKVAEGDISYTFTTDQGIEYLIVFDDKTSNFTTNDIGNSILYEYQFYPVKDTEREPLDERIMATVMYSITQTMKTSSNVVLYICENSDHKAKVRDRYFDSIFRKYATKELLKIDGTVKASAHTEDLSFISVIVNNDNPDKDKVNYTFQSVLFQSQLRKDSTFNL